MKLDPKKEERKKVMIGSVKRTILEELTRRVEGGMNQTNLRRLRESEIDKSGDYLFEYSKPIPRRRIY